MEEKGLIEQLQGKGVNRVVFGLETQPEAESLAWLDEQAEIVEWAQGLG